MRRSSSASRRPRLRGIQPATAARGASISTSMENAHPSARCSSTARAGSRSAGGSKVWSRSRTSRTPVHPQCSFRVGAVRPAQQIPASAPRGHCPRVDLHAAQAVRTQEAVEPDAPGRGAGLHQLRRRLRVGRCVGSRRRRARRGQRPDRLGRRRSGRREHPDDLGQRASRRIVQLGGSWPLFQDGHDQPERLGHREGQRWWPETPAGDVGQHGCPIRKGIVRIRLQPDRMSDFIADPWPEPPAGNDIDTMLGSLDRSGPRSPGSPADWTRPGWRRDSSRRR